jgi:hypothetical protein
MRASCLDRHLPTYRHFCAHPERRATLRDCSFAEVFGYDGASAASESVEFTAAAGTVVFWREYLSSCSSVPWHGSQSRRSTQYALARVPATWSCCPPIVTLLTHLDHAWYALDLPHADSLIFHSGSTNVTGLTPRLAIFARWHHPAMERARSPLPALVGDEQLGIQEDQEDSHLWDAWNCFGEDQMQPPQQQPPPSGAARL